MTTETTHVRLLVEHEFTVHLNGEPLTAYALHREGELLMDLLVRSIDAGKPVSDPSTSSDAAVGSILVSLTAVADLGEFRALWAHGDATRAAILAAGCGHEPWFAATPGRPTYSTVGISITPAGE